MSVIYLDNASTTWPKPACVERAMCRFLAEQGANPRRGGHRMALECAHTIEQLRVRLNRLFDGDDSDRVVFTLNTTDALNIAIRGVLEPGDHVITSVLEHNSVSRPLQALADAGTIELTRVAGTQPGFIDPSSISAALRPQTRLIACTHCSNVIGTIQPIEAIGRIARQHDVLFLVDAAQSAGLLPIAMRDMQIDLLAVAGHKSLLGPPGTGALLVGKRAEVKHWREGGTGGDSQSNRQPEEYPHRLEAGTPNTLGLAGLAAAIEELESLGAANILRHEQNLAVQFAAAFESDDRVYILAPGDSDRRTGTFAFTLADIDPQDIATILDESFGIAVRAGLHCAPGLHQSLGTFPAGAVRVSPGAYNTERDIALLINAVTQIRDGEKL